jgi:neutral ceramidase
VSGSRHVHLRAGTALTDISPPAGIELAGYPHHPRHNRGIHDPLYAACLYLEDGGSRLAIVTADILMISKRHVQAVRARVAERTGIPPDNLMIACSHTHSGPWASGRLDLEALERGLEPEQEYVQALQRKLVALVEQASGSLFEAQVGVDKGYCGREQGVGGNRHHPQGIADPEVWVVGVQDPQGRWRACLVRYALHPTFLHSDNLLVSADYPGYLRRRLAESHPGMVFLFAQGASGNQSPRFFRSGKTFAEAERVGVELAKAAENVLEGMEVEDAPSLSASSTETDLELRGLPPRGEAEARVAAAKAEWERLRAAARPPEEQWLAELELLGAEDTLGYILQNEKGRRLPLRDDALPAEVQVLGIGDARLVGVQGELFAELGLTIQYRSPFARTVVIELANGCLPGYAATARAYAEGGYEAGTSLLSGRGGDRLVETAVELLYRSRITRPRPD